VHAGHSIALIHEPPRITLHSIQNGREERDLPIRQFVQSGSQLTRVWWLPQDKQKKRDAIPDIFKRGDVIVRCVFNRTKRIVRLTSFKPGSALSILKLLPLLDPVEDDGQMSMSVFTLKYTYSSKAEVI